MMNIALVTAVVVLGTMAGQLEAGIFGKCATPPVQASFDLNQYLGLWYENMKYFSIPEHIMTCVSAKYTVNGTNIDIYNRGLVDGGYEDGVLFTATQDSNEAARWSVSAPIIGSAPYLILDTDFTNYAVVYSCKSFAFLKNEQLWILTRARVPLDDALKTKLFTELSGWSIDPSELKVDDQTNCPPVELF